MRSARISLLALVAANPSTAGNPIRTAGEGARRATSKSGGPARHAAPSRASRSSRTQQGSVARAPGSSSARTTATSAKRRKTARKQRALPPSASRPCSLVTKRQARAIVGAPVLEPLEAPQGPTCIYQTKARTTYVTLVVQRVDFAKLRKQIRNPRSVSIAGRTGYCGSYGRHMLVVPVKGGRTLTISAPCRMAVRFASRAAAHL